MVGTRRVDDDVGGTRRLRQNFSVVERAQHRLNAPRADCLGLFRRAHQTAHLMAGGDEMRRHRSADIARRARAEDFHSTPPSSLSATKREAFVQGSEATKQSMPPREEDGLLRFARNDDQIRLLTPDAS
jgi:hypothetical protein